MSLTTQEKNYSHFLDTITVDGSDVVGAVDENGCHQVPHTLKQVAVLVLGQDCHHHEVHIL